MTYKFIVGKKYVTLMEASIAASDDFVNGTTWNVRLKKAHAIFNAYKKGQYVPATHRHKGVSQ